MTTKKTTPKPATNNVPAPSDAPNTSTAVAIAEAPAPVNPLAALMDPNQPFDMNVLVEAARARLAVVQDSVRDDAETYQQIEKEIKDKQEEISVLRKQLEEINERVKGPRAEMAKLNAIIQPAAATGVPRRTGARASGSLPVWLADLPAVFTAEDIQSKYEVSRAVINQTLSQLSKPEDGRVIRQERGKYTLA